MDTKVAHFAYVISVLHSLMDSRKSRKEFVKFRVFKLLMGMDDLEFNEIM